MAKKSAAVKAPAKNIKSVAASPVLREDARAFKREMIIGAAIEIFYRDGYQAATVDAVAAAVSATKAAVYYYFESKDALLQAIVTRCSDLTLEAVEQGIVSGDSPAKRLALACFCFAEMVLKNQKMIAVYFREERYFSAGLRERVTGAEKSVTSKLSKVIEAGSRDGSFRPCDAQLLALSITGMISMSFYWYTEHGRLPKRDLARNFAQEALRLVSFKDEDVLEEWLAISR